MLGDTLAAVRWTIGVLSAGHAFRPVITIKANRCFTITSAVRIYVADGTRTSSARRRIIWTMGIFSTCSAAQPTGACYAERCFTTAAGIIRQVAELAGIGNALTRRIDAVSIA